MSLDPSHLEAAVPCPFLPFPVEPMTSDCMKALQGDRGQRFYETTLRYAQSLWLQGLPARALLLINRAFSADLESQDRVFEIWPHPYAAAGWVMRHRSPNQFLGNPRRHYQHLATRMVEPRRELRSWRAWACWYLVRMVLPDCPADEEQIAEEGIAEPGREEIAFHLQRVGWTGEFDSWKDAIRYLAKEGVEAEEAGSIE
jgi:hypothetical protein